MLIYASAALVDQSIRERWGRSSEFRNSLWKEEVRSDSLVLEQH
jgi:hypothetical protein